MPVNLSKKHCVPCEGGVAPLTRKEAEIFLGQIEEWTLHADGKSISKQYTCKNFLESIGFANKIAAVAEAEGHHPDLSVSWGKLGVELSTHARGGLSENDFILAAKIDKIA